MNGKLKGCKSYYFAQEINHRKDMKNHTKTYDDFIKQFIDKHKVLSQWIFIENPKVIFDDTSYPL